MSSLKFSHLLLSILFLIDFSSTLHAHTEHEEIQVTTTFQVNQKQQLSAISMSWQYDTLSSQDMLSHEKDLNKLAKLLVSDLARMNYFTRINIGDRRVVANKISQYKIIKVKDRDNNAALQLNFKLQLNQAISIKLLRKMNIDHADPTGRAILFYDGPNDILFTSELKTKCITQVKEKAEFKEGQFPQIVTINCAA